MRVLLIGAYGFIGSAIARRLQADGFQVIGLGRKVTLGRRLLPGLEWRAGDLNRLLRDRDWMPLLAGVDVVINASGALQDGMGDRLERTQQLAIMALVRACERIGIIRFVQISATAAKSSASTAFMRTKAAADTCLAASALDWVILRPGLVIGRNAYGGTALIRAMAVLPVALLVHSNQPVQCVDIEDVAGAAADAVAGRLTPGADIDLVEPTPHRLADVVAAHRAWLGLPPVDRTFDLPAGFATPIRKFADLLGWLGWRSPLRTSALRAIEDGVRGQAPPDRPCASLDTILSLHQSGSQDRLQARLILLLPAIIGALALLWIGSGVLGIAQAGRAAAVLSVLPSEAAINIVRICGLLDVALGAAILFRAWSQRAALLMAAVSLAYLVGGTAWVPELWLDPLGPLLKAVPALVLALVAMSLLDER